MTEQEMWRTIESLKWKSDHNYKRIASELSVLDENSLTELENFVNTKYRSLYGTYEDAWLGNDDGPGISVGDDGWSDLIYDVIGRGEEFYNSINSDKLREMANNYDFEESFCYCF